MGFIDKLKGYKTLPEPVKASAWYTVCNVLNKGMALLATPIFTRIMTKDQYGSYSVFMSWYNILIIVGTLNVFMSSYSKGMLTYAEQERKFTSSQLGLCTTLTTVLLVVYLLFRDFWTQALGLSPVLMIAMFMLLYATPATDFWIARERFNYKYKKSVVVTLVSTVLSMALGVVAVLAMDQKTEARVFTDVGVKAAIGFAFYGLLFFRGRCFYDGPMWKYGLMFNLGLIPHYLSHFVLNQADRVMIGKMVGTDAAAVYSVAYTISTVMLLITSAIDNSLNPYVYKAIHGGKQKDIRKATRPLIYLVAALSVVTMCFAPEVILIFAGKEYTEAIWVIPPIAASVYFIFAYSMFSTVEYYYQRTGLIAVASVVAAVANLILNYIFIKLFGYYAAGYTTLACYILLALFHYIFYRKVLRQDMQEEKPIHDVGVILLCSVAVIGIMLAMVLTYRWALVRYGILVLLAVVAIIRRKDLAGLLKFD